MIQEPYPPESRHTIAPAPLEWRGSQLLRPLLLNKMVLGPADGQSETKLLVLKLGLTYSSYFMCCLLPGPIAGRPDPGLDPEARAKSPQFI
jgi:hypothetical protein